jgi:hypothetical protein
MNSNNDNESKNNMEDKLSSLSSSIQSGLKSLTTSSSASASPLMGDSSDSNTSSNKILGMDWKIFVLIIFIFGLLGINIFIYLAVGTQDVINALKPITTAIGNFFHSIFKGSILNIFTNAIRGVYDLLYIAQGTIKGGVSAADTLTLQQTGNSSLNNIINPINTQASNTPSPSTQSYKQPTSLPQTVASNGSIKNNGQSPTSQQIPQLPTSLKNIPAQNVANSIPLANSLNNNALDKALNTALIQDTNGSMNNNSISNNMSNTFNYTADDSMSNIQQSKSNSKSGWCFIGEDRGFRSCIQVNENEKCMSGDIFPSQEICINPNLRQ